MKDPVPSPITNGVRDVEDDPSHVGKRVQYKLQYVILDFLFFA